MGLAAESYDADVALQHDQGDLSPEAMTRESIGADQYRILGHRGTMVSALNPDCAVERARLAC